MAITLLESRAHEKESVLLFICHPTSRDPARDVAKVLSIGSRCSPSLTSDLVVNNERGVASYHHNRLARASRDKYSHEVQG
jgi:hypothetical protein